MAQIESLTCLPSVDGEVMEADPRAIAGNLGIETNQGIATLYRCALLQLCLGDKEIRKAWADKDGQPLPALVIACSEVRLRYRTRNVNSLRRRVVALAENYHELGHAAE